MFVCVSYPRECYTINIMIAYSMLEHSYTSHARSLVGGGGGDLPVVSVCITTFYPFASSNLVQVNLGGGGGGGGGRSPPNYLALLAM